MRIDAPGFATCMERIDMLAALRPGSRVVVSAVNPYRLAAAYLTCWERELVAVPLDPTAPIAFQEHVRVHAEPHAEVRDDRLVILARDAIEPSPRGDAFIVYTSGTTGRPKGVVLGRAPVEINARAVAARHEFGPGRRHVTCLPLSHCNAIMMSLFGTYFANGDVTFVRPFKPGTFAAACVGAHMANIAPALLDDFVAAGAPWPPGLKYMLTAAAALPRSLAERFHNAYGPARLVQGYGMSEAVNFSFTMPDLTPEEWRRQYLCQTPPVGEPIAETQYRIVDDELQLHGPCMLRGYWRDDVATREAYDGNWLRTGDLATVNEDGYVVLTGRGKEIINRGGDKLSPVALDEAYRAAGVSGPFAVVPAVDARLGDAVAVCGVADVRVGFARLEPRLRPAVVTEEPVQRTSTGKPQRTASGRRLVALTLPADDYETVAAAVRPLARRLAGLAPSDDPQRRYLRDRGAALAETGVGGASAPTVDRVLAAIEHGLDAWVEGRVSGAALIRSAGPDAWEALMCDAPMGHYATLAARFLESRGLLAGTVVELGAGVGNLSRLIGPQASGRYVRTDALPRFLNGKWATEEAVVDFDRDFPPSLPSADVVVAVNALHCSADPVAALTRIHAALKPGGYVVLGEGGPRPDGATPWALDVLFGFLDGWWDRGGFRARDVWLEDLGIIGYRDVGYSVLRAGPYDLGGLVWARR